MTSHVSVSESYSSSAVKRLPTLMPHGNKIQQNAQMWLAASSYKALELKSRRRPSGSKRDYVSRFQVSSWTLGVWGEHLRLFHLILTCWLIHRANKEVIWPKTSQWDDSCHFYTKAFVWIKQRRFEALQTLEMWIHVFRQRCFRSLFKKEFIIQSLFKTNVKSHCESVKLRNLDVTQRPLVVLLDTLKKKNYNGKEAAMHKTDELRIISSDRKVRGTWR